MPLDPPRLASHLQHSHEKVHCLPKSTPPPYLELACKCIFQSYILNKCWLSSTYGYNWSNWQYFMQIKQSFSSHWKGFFNFLVPPFLIFQYNTSCNWDLFAWWGFSEVLTHPCTVQSFKLCGGLFPVSISNEMMTHNWTCIIVLSKHYSLTTKHTVGIGILG